MSYPAIAPAPTLSNEQPGSGSGYNPEMAIIYASIATLYFLMGAFLGGVVVWIVL